MGRGSVFSFFLIGLFQAKLNFNFQFRKIFPSEVSYGCLPNSFHWTAGARLGWGGPTEWKSFFLFFGSSLVIDNDTHPPAPQPSCFSCVVPPSPFPLVAFSVRQHSQGLRLSNRDCACLRLSRGFEVGSYPSWAIQPSILAWHRLQSGQVLWGEGEITGCGFSLFYPNICLDNRVAFSPINNLHCCTVLLKRCPWHILIEEHINLS